MPKKMSGANHLPVVCPICLRPPELCKLLQDLPNFKWAKELKYGTTITRALSLLHPEVCPKCRQPKKKCGDNFVNDHCKPRRTSLQAMFPHWFNWEDLLPQDKDYVHHANGTIG